MLGVITGAVLVLIGAVLTVLIWWAGVPAIVVGALGAAWVWWWAPRNQRSWGYTEAPEDFVVRGGIMFRRLVAVPYGRMQFVDVEAGPIARHFGFATVTLHTASTKTAAGIPGVPIDEANRLRNRLTELGDSRGAGV
ncbi:hypothetical protein D9V41_03980 [Aeromicrobium phragmitis]|uniref:YdbS-like PH domain-containing protein n=2 Tax=Aeromicrobium phragmitis TaxID=2478914 RepID=A0A3L8PP12_9ACTN|nr:hypothetical protein D9V41_03980 [Aeromicrobium phragmitis]